VASGPSRFEDIKRQGSEVLSRVRSGYPPHSELSSPRLFGGFAFGDDGAKSAVWQGFAPARFVLPRVTYTTADDRAVVTLAVERSELDAGGDCLGLLQRVYEVLASPLEVHRACEAVSVTSWEPPARDFRERVDTLLGLIACGELQKAVAAREVRMAFSQDLLPVATAIALHEQAPECLRFLFQAGEASFVGATPERLIHKRGRDLETEALAGSIDAGAESPEHSLQANPKELEEHRLVVHAIVRALAPLSIHTEVPARPGVHTLKHLLHLRTPICARLHSDTHALDLLERLHPTPAVGGVPTDRALRWIARSEPFDRGWYAGAVGWFDRQGDGDFNVALRSGLMRGRDAWLYAGAGIVTDSAAASEYQETTLKLAALLASLRATA
jgi:menaquinone-specific isochorismate synthase